MATAVNTVAGSGAIPPVDMPNPANKPKKRTEAANAFSVNEPGQPSRAGNNAQERAASLGKIVDWLAPEAAAHKRYQPTASATFCNVYAHDYCHLAGVYLPRVWWKPDALAKWAAGVTVTPEYDVTIEEITANAARARLRAASFGALVAIRASTDGADSAAPTPCSARDVTSSHGAWASPPPQRAG